MTSVARIDNRSFNGFQPLTRDALRLALPDSLPVSTLELRLCGRSRAQPALWNLHLGGRADARDRTANRATGHGSRLCMTRNPVTSRADTSIAYALNLGVECFRHIRLSMMRAGWSRRSRCESDPLRHVRAPSPRDRRVRPLAAISLGHLPRPLSLDYRPLRVAESHAKPKAPSINAISQARPSADGRRGA